MPPGTELCIRVVNEATDVCADQWYTHNILHHRANHRVTHHLLSGEVVTKPPARILALAWERRPCDDHGTLVLFLEPGIGSPHLQHAESGVSIELGNRAAIVHEVYRVYVNGLLLEISASRYVRQLSHLAIFYLLLREAYAVAEVRNLVHVKPQSIEGKALVELTDEIFPPVHCLFLKEVREGCITGPHFPDKRS